MKVTVIRPGRMKVATDDGARASEHRCGCSRRPATADRCDCDTWRSTPRPLITARKAQRIGGFADAKSWPTKRFSSSWTIPPTTVTIEPRPALQEDRRREPEFHVTMEITSGSEFRGRHCGRTWVATHCDLAARLTTLC